MTVTQTPTEAWHQAIDAYVEHANELAGVTKSAPGIFEATGPYSFPLIRTHVIEDQIRLFAAANGDANPLWSDPAYGRQSCWGSVIAPPLFDACLSEAPWFPDPPQVPGWTMFGAGSRRTYFEHLRPGDVIRAEDTFRGIEEKRSGKGYRLFVLTGDRAFINQNGDVALVLTGRGIVTARPPGLEGNGLGLAFPGRVRRRYTVEELNAIAEGYERELSGATHRGAEPRWWEDVIIGEEIPQILKGPYDISDATAFAGIAGLTPAFAVKWPMVRSDVGRTPVDPETGAPHFSIDWHFLDSVARQAGLPYAHVFVTHLEMMVGHAITNWMGDAGILIMLDVQVRTPMFHGDVARTRGHVTGRRVQDGRHVIDLSVVVETLDGAQCVRGTATVALPRRAEGGAGKGR